RGGSGNARGTIPPPRRRNDGLRRTRGSWPVAAAGGRRGLLAWLLLSDLRAPAAPNLPMTPASSPHDRARPLPRMLALLLLVAFLGSTGCTTIKGWFKDSDDASEGVPAA